MYVIKLIELLAETSDVRRLQELHTGVLLIGVVLQGHNWLSICMILFGYCKDSNTVLCKNERSINSLTAKGGEFD